SRRCTSFRTRPGRGRRRRRPTACRSRSRGGEASGCARCRAKRAFAAGARRSEATTWFSSIAPAEATARTIRPGWSTRPSASWCACARRQSRRRGSSLPDDCIFYRIVRGDAAATVVNRADGFVAIEDIAPKADTHLLVIPERHIETFRDVSVLGEEEAKRMIDFVAETAKAAGLDEYRLMIFVGAGAGQTVFHLHWHILGGRFHGLPA